MKYVLIVGDGMADRPLAALGGKTPLQAAVKPNMDRVAKEGRTGLVKTCPPEWFPGTEVCTMALMSYDPVTFFRGRGPLEALGRGLALKKNEVAYRCNLVTVKGGAMEDYSAGHITTEEAKPLVQMLDKRLGLEDMAFHAGVSYRHLMVWKGGSEDVRSTPPHNIVGQPFADHLPAGKGESKLRQVMEDSRILLEGHEVNRTRRAKGLRPGNMIWLWSPGKTPVVPAFKEKYGIGGGVISAVDVVRGIGVLAGLEVIKVPGATGYFDTDYAAKGAAAVKALKSREFVFVHVEAPDEAGHEGLVEEKVKAIERIDEHVVGQILAAESKLGGLGVLLMPDHPTPIDVRTHVDDPVPVAMRRPGDAPDGVDRFDEESVKGGSLAVTEATALLDEFFANREAAG